MANYRSRTFPSAGAGDHATLSLNQGAEIMKWVLYGSAEYERLKTAGWTVGESERRDGDLMICMHQPKELKS